MNFLDDNESWYSFTDIPESEDEIGFDVYENYLDNIVRNIKLEYKNKFLAAVAQNTSSMKGGNGFSLEYIKRFLFLGWNTECLVKINDSLPDVELLRINNQWKPIQVYYSIYSVCEATYHALTNQKIESHAGCLRHMSEYLSKSPHKPWSYAFIGYQGNKRVPRTIKPINFTKGLIIPSPLQRNSASSEETIACCLQAEHRNRIRDFRPQKKQYKYLHDPKHTTLLHFLYRLRIKSNYKDVEIFLAKAPEGKIRSFSSNLTSICKYTNALCEIIILRRIGKKT